MTPSCRISLDLKSPTSYLCTGIALVDITPTDASPYFIQGSMCVLFAQEPRREERLHESARV